VAAAAVAAAVTVEGGAAVAAGAVTAEGVAAAVADTNGQDRRQRIKYKDPATIAAGSLCYRERLRRSRSLLHLVRLALAAENVTHFLRAPVLAARGVSAAADVGASLLAADNLLFGHTDRLFWLLRHGQAPW
jgi:hypothetical protein